MKTLILSLILMFLLSACTDNKSSTNTQNPEEEITHISSKTTKLVAASSKIDSIPIDTLASTSKEQSLSLKQKKRSVLDYFLALPEKEYFQCDCEENPTPKERASYIKRKNLRDGYILASDGCNELDLSVVLFRDKINDRDIIAVDNIWVTGDYFCVIDGETGLFELTESGTWKNVTEEFIDLEGIYKALDLDSYRISLLYPEKGTTVKVLSKEDTNKVLGYLIFKDSQFIFQKKEK